MRGLGNAWSSINGIQCFTPTLPKSSIIITYHHKLEREQEERERERVMGKISEKSGGGGEAASPPVEMESRGNGEANTSMRTVETLLRLVPLALCAVALLVMLKNSQSNDFGSVSYSDLGAFRYLVHANGICAGYSLLSAIIAAMPRPSTMSRAWTFFFLDQVLTYVILAAGTASTEVLYLAYKGDAAITWSTACGSFGGFCRKATASVAITFVTVICYAALSLLSSYKLFSKYDAPIGYSSKGAAAVEIGAFHS